MKIRKHTIFLLISLSVFVASLIEVIISYSDAATELKSILSEITDTQRRVGLEASLFLGLFFTIPVLGSELSFIRSIYKMLKHKPKKLIRICYFLSAFFAFISVVFYCLVTLKVFNFVSAPGRDYTGDIYLFTFWPAFFVSFALGSAPIKHNN